MYVLNAQTKKKKLGQLLSYKNVIYFINVNLNNTYGTFKLC